MISSKVLIAAAVLAIVALLIWQQKAIGDYLYLIKWLAT